ncbi:hypothetical protein [Microcoleus sp. B9-D4]|uniref:hypothetical protein n=1 Tax=Microcoleus sp. B9-D4 TaxID=2818711 RepID=UPI002FD1B77C
MTQPNILELAKQGDAKAIALLLNRQLQAKGITAAASLKDGCLQVMLESAEAPSQQVLAPWVSKSIAGLGAASIEKVKVYGRQTGAKVPAWSQEFEVAGPNLPVANVTEGRASSSDNTESNQLSLKERAKLGDVEAIASLLNLPLQNKGISATASLQDGCLQVMLEGDRVPDEEASIRIVRRELTNLKAGAIASVKVYGQQVGEDFPAWNREFEIATEVDSLEGKIEVIASQSALSKPSIRKKSLPKVSKTIPLYQANPQNQNLFLKVGVAVGVLLIVGSGISIVFFRFKQEQTINKAKILIVQAMESERGSSIEILTKSEQQLQEAIVLLTTINDFPGSVYPKAQSELATTRTRLQVVQAIAKAQALIVKSENSEGASDINVLKNSEKNLQEALAILGRLTNVDGSLSPQIQSELDITRNVLEKVTKKIKEVEEIQTAEKTLIDQFSGVQSRLDVGMNYRDYSEQLRELKVSIDKFARLAGSNSSPVYAKLVEAFKHYDFALDVWQYYIESDEKYNLFPATSTTGTVLVEEYQVPTDDILGTPYISLNRALSKIWSRADSQIKEAQQPEKSKPKEVTKETQQQI